MFTAQYKILPMPRHGKCLKLLKIFAICFISLHVYHWVKNIPSRQFSSYLNESNYYTRKDAHLSSSKSKILCFPQAAKTMLNQQIISISMFGPSENSLFQKNTSLRFLEELIEDARRVYPGWILRVYYDNTTEATSLQRIGSQYQDVSFCDMTGIVSPPPRMWRFLPMDDNQVDISKLILLSNIID
jgi:hypothetical protein